MTIINHSERQPIGNKLIVFLDTIPNVKIDGGWKYKETDILIAANDEIRTEIAHRATSGILLAMGSQCFLDVPEAERPIVGDRVTFTSYSGLHKPRGNFVYRSLQDTEIHDFDLPQRNKILQETKK